MSGEGTYVENDDHQFSMLAPYGLVSSRFDMTQGYAENSFNAALGYISDMSNMVSAYSLPSTSLSQVSLPPLVGLNYVRRPTFGSMATVQWPENTTQLDLFEDVPDMPDIAIPTMGFVPPAWDTPDKPVFREITPPGEAPVPGDVDIPTAPGMNLPEVPEVGDIMLPVAPVISLPEFDATLPDQVLDPPAGFSYQEQQFDSDVGAALRSKILYDMQNGGTGLAPLVEQELIDRAKYRQQAENDRLIRNIEGSFGENGFDLPPGALAGALLEAGQQILRTDTEVNGQIFIEQARLAQTNTHFMVDKGLNVWQVEIEFHNAQANRTLDAAKTVATIGIELFNARINQYNLEIEKYKARAMVYETRVKAALTSVEIFKAQIEGAKVEASVKELFVSIYEKQLGAIDTMAKIYSSQLQGAEIRSRIEGQRLENYRLSTQAYVAQLDGEKTKFDAFASEIGAEKVKADVYLAQVQSFVAEVEGAKALVGLSTARADHAIKSNTLKVEKYRAELTGYLAGIDATSKQIGAEVEGFKAEVAAYSAETDAEGSYYSAKAKEMDALINNSRLTLEKAVAEIDASIKGYLGLKELELESSKGVTQVTAQLASAALNAVNASASIGYSSSENRDESWRHSDGITESHSFDETLT